MRLEDSWKAPRVDKAVSLASTPSRNAHQETHHLSGNLSRKSMNFSSLRAQKLAVSHCVEAVYPIVGLLITPFGRLPLRRTTVTPVISFGAVNIAAIWPMELEFRKRHPLRNRKLQKAAASLLRSPKWA